MFAKLRQRLGQVRGVEFCESCSEVCTAGCRADARYDRMRTEAMLRIGLPR
ncbi:hypothetical protein [Hamadaea tsunoensis]|uniref:hypothetical protein n=1 Tax=Hamadaea tsunoensis TaxID=53368 RepID=UPI00041C1088|nr:hypothetical protein [Hamadaea tsunoensis]